MVMDELAWWCASRAQGRATRWARIAGGGKLEAAGVERGRGELELAVLWAAAGVMGRANTERLGK